MSKYEKDSLYDGKKFLCANMKHIYECLNGEELTKLQEILLKVYEKHPNEYLIVNQDEPYADDVWNLIKEKEKKEIVAFVGNAGSGKSYQSYLLTQKGYKELAFADVLRKIAFTSLGINFDDGMKTYDYMKTHNVISVKITENHVINSTFRQFLEKLGSEGIRKYDNDFWCKGLIKEIQENNYKKVCISDMRFLNEYNHIKKFSEENNYDFKVIFCDYHSDRYDYNNSHVSAKLANYFVDKGYKDLQELTDEDFRKYKEEIGE